MSDVTALNDGKTKIAHELRNRLHAIVVQAALTRRAADPEVAEDLCRINQLAREATEMVEQLLAERVTR